MRIRLPNNFAGAVLGAMLAGVVAIVAGVALDVVIDSRTGPDVVLGGVQVFVFVTAWYVVKRLR